MNLKEKLNRIQTELKAPKGQFNKFGNYAYRSCEDVLEGLKPLLRETKTSITMSDTIKHIGDRYYVRAKIKLLDDESDEIIEVCAYARETLDRKGMDESQITGATSSYARKYALNGMFAIDDNKDADTQAPKETTAVSSFKRGLEKSAETLDKEKIVELIKFFDPTVKTADQYATYIKEKTGDELKAENYKTIIDKLEIIVAESI